MRLPFGACGFLGLKRLHELVLKLPGGGVDQIRKARADMRRDILTGERLRQPLAEFVYA
jgi:hypothetical protein